MGLAEGKTMTSKKGAAPPRKGAMTLADYEARVESIGISAGSRFVRGNVALKLGYMYTPTKFERERAAVLGKAGIKYKKN